MSGKESKLQIAHDRIEAILPVLTDVEHVLLLFDSWYAKKKMLSLCDDWPALDIVCAARTDTAMYDLPPARTGKRGRPRKRGNRVRPADFQLGDIGTEQYIGGIRTVLTNILGKRQVTALVTAPAAGGGSRRLYLSTITPDELSVVFGGAFSAPSATNILVYRLRWNIETYYYQAKKWWALLDYKVRSEDGIERLLNTEATAYAAMEMLPYCWEELYDPRDASPQVVRLALGRAIQEDLVFNKLRSSAEQKEIGKPVQKALNRLIEERCKEA